MNEEPLNTLVMERGVLWLEPDSSNMQILALRSPEPVEVSLTGLRGAFKYQLTRLVCLLQNIKCFSTCSCGFLP